MFFSILIATYQNTDYLKICIDSILKNSYFKTHQIIVHVNGLDNDTINFLNRNNIQFRNSNVNLGLCRSINNISILSTSEYILYSHDDMYFLPKWDFYLYEEVKKLNTNKFFLSSTQISPKLPVKNTITQHICANFGNTIRDFNESSLLKNFNNYSFNDMQGSHWAPHLIHREIWNSVGGFSEEFNLGDGSDPDLNYKLWNKGIRIFKMVSKSRIYHFGSLTTRKNKNVKKNNGAKIFLLKWGISIKLFTEFFLRRGEIYDGPLIDKKVNLNFLIELYKSKLKFFYYKFIYEKKNYS